MDVVGMNEIDQLASAMLVLVFAAVMLVVGHLYVENRSQKLAASPPMQMVSVPPSQTTIGLRSKSPNPAARTYGWNEF